MAIRIRPELKVDALELLEQRYLLRDSEGQVIESPEGMFERVSWGNEEYYNMMASLDFLPNSPTLFNGGTDRGTLSACFKFDVPDSMDGIMDVARKAALVLKYGGGVGYTFSAIRPRGAPVRTTHRSACGPVAVMRHYHSVAEMVAQGGVRPGAQMGILHCDHEDLLEFIDCKSTEGSAKSLSTFNISVAATDKWMEKQLAGNNRYLRAMASNAWHTGDPGLYFIDAAERANPTPWLGQLTGTNPCGEVPLLDNEPCNLGSINLGHMVHHHEVDWRKLEYTTRLATRYLDDVLDHNIFPDASISQIALTTRKLGLGVMGWADMLCLLNIHYDSEEAVQLGDDLMSMINKWARDESSAIAETKGHAPCYELLAPAGVRQEDYPPAQMLRNATRTCIAPTGSISIIADAWGGIEPHFDYEIKHRMANGTILNRKLSCLEDSNSFLSHLSRDIDPIWHLRHQAAFQKHTDLAVSKTINLPHSATPEDIYNIYIEAWKLGCKGVTVFRDGSRSEQVIEGQQPSQQDVSPALAAPSPVRRKLPDERSAITHKFQIGDEEGYITVGLYPDGSPGELFLTVNKEGSTIAGLLDSVGILSSLALQYGVPVDAISRKLRNVTFEPSGITGNKEIPTATSISDYIAHWLQHKFIEGADRRLTYSAEQIGTEIVKTGLTCPDCGSQVVAMEGCVKCLQCGWNRCG